MLSSSEPNTETAVVKKKGYRLSLARVPLIQIHLYVILHFPKTNINAMETCILM